MFLSVSVCIAGRNNIRHILGDLRRFGRSVHSKPVILCLYHLFDCGIGIHHVRLKLKVDHAGSAYIIQLSFQVGFNICTSFNPVGTKLIIVFLVLIRDDRGLDTG